jgi:proteasome lid subunit RPN8/RPN11
MAVFTVPRSLLAETEHALRDATGERTVLWQLAEPAEEAMTVRRLVIPRQQAVSTECGYMVHVTSAELARQQLDAYRLGLRTWIQVHTHPGTDVRMSEVDRAWAIADFPGALSVIVPNFGRDGLAGWRGVGVHERTDHGWRTLSGNQLPGVLVVR